MARPGGARSLANYTLPCWLLLLLELASAGGAVVCGFEYLAWCLFLGIPQDGRTTWRGVEKKERRRGWDGRGLVGDPDGWRQLVLKWMFSTSAPGPCADG